MLQDKKRLTPARTGTPATREEIDIFALLGALWRGKVTVLACMIVALGLGAYYAFVVATPKYASAAALALELRNEPVVDIEAVVGGASTEDAAMNTEVEVIRSREILTELVRQMDLTDDPEFNEALQPEPLFTIDPIILAVRAALGGETDPEPMIPPEEAELIATVDEVREAISASVQRNTYIFDITVTTGHPLKSRHMANRLAEIYIADQMGQKFAATETAVEWLSERVSELGIELRNQEDRLKLFRTETDLVSLETVEALNRQLADARDRLASARAEVSVAEAGLERVAELRAAGDTAGLAEVFGDPALNRLVAGGQTATARIETLTTRDETALTRLRQQTETLENSVARLEADVLRQSESLSEFEQLEREIEATRTLYETFLTRLKETTVQRGLQQADSRILSAAVPGTYIAPRKGVLLILAGTLGLLVGAALVFVRQFLNKGYRAADELEADTARPIIGQIPIMPIKRRDQLLTYLNDKPTSPAAEAIRNLRTSILLSSPDRPPQVIMSTSSLPGEGKTTQAISLAHNLAGLGKKVVLIEGDVRRRTLDEYFRSSAGKEGLVTAMNRGNGDIADLVIRDPRFDVDVLLGERSKVNAADLFSSDLFRNFLDGLRATYDYVVIDTPPVLVVPDARVIGQHADTIVFNVAWDRTGRAQVREALRQLATVNLDTSGLVLTQINGAAMKRYGYGGKYGAYGTYGSSYYDA
mgnify:CR=1 FL=1